MTLEIIITKSSMFIIKKKLILIIMLQSFIQIGFSQAISTPNYSNMSYGEHSRNILDLWISEGDSPRPLLIYIHGGGWLNGDKDKILEQVPIMEWLDKGVSVASINYRYSSQAPLPATLLDIARAIQFLRYKANDYNLDPSKVGLQGGSAGGCAALWILFHDDLADSSSLDPVLRESTRIQGAIGQFPQTSIDPMLLNEWIGENAASHPMIYNAVGAANYQDLINNYNQYKTLIDEFSPINHLDTEDPPLFLIYPGDMTLPALTVNEAIHHPMFGGKLIEKANAVGYNIKLCGLSNELNIGSLDEAKFLMGKVLLPCEVNKTGTLTANPTTVAAFTNANGTGNTLLTMTSSNAAKVVITHQSTNGITTTAETIVINNNQLSFSDWAINYIQPGRTHTFRLYATEASSSVLGDLLDTVIVTGNTTLSVNYDIDMQDKQAFTVFPNPFTNQFCISLIDYKGSAFKLSLFDMAGKMIVAPQMIQTDTDFTYDASMVKKGVYMIKILINNKTVVIRKIVKN
jgi:arylformamidase